MDVNNDNLLGKWERAYLKQSHNAAVGRFFKGLIHNLNGVAQAFSMQTEVLAMMFEQAPGLIDEALQASTPEEFGEILGKLQTMIQRRARISGQMSEAVGSMQMIMQQTCAGMEESRDQTAVQPYTLNSVLESEFEFIKADSFFKHKVKKELTLSTDLPPLKCLRVELHQIFFILLSNARFAVTEVESPHINIVTSFNDDTITLTVTDNGPGVSVAEHEDIFTPFYSTWPGDDHDGLGLYLARRIAASFAGELQCDPEYSTGARFILSFPGARALCDA